MTGDSHSGARLGNLFTHKLTHTAARCNSDCPWGSAETTAITTISEGDYRSTKGSETRHGKRVILSVWSNASHGVDVCYPETF